MQPSTRAFHELRTCLDDQCVRALDNSGARGLCGRCYRRRRANGSLGEFHRIRSDDPATQFFAKVDAAGVCWEWRAAVNNRGYGKFRQMFAHRWAWEYLIGPIPDGLTIDHLCRNIVCVNPDHLEVVTKAENNRRAHGHRTACIRGHAYAEHGYTVPKTGHRWCLLCQQMRRAGAL